jgi:hypothetical protein
MKKKIITFCTIALSVALLTVIIKHNHSASDKMAIELTKQFCDKMNIINNSDPIIHNDNSGKLSFALRIDRLLRDINKDKEVIVGKSGDFEHDFLINNNNEIVRYTHSTVIPKMFKKYKIERDNRKPRNWPPLLSEDKAKELIFTYANKIGLPKDVVFSRMMLDLENSGTWIAFWVRTLNGYPYEEDRLSIAITAVDGELYSYGRYFVGKPCPTEVTVTKEEAVAKGWDKVGSYLDYGKRDNLQKDYYVKSTQLKIVQPNTFLGFVVPWKSSRSRLAWVITYELNYNDEKKRIEVGYHDRFVIKIDAANKSFLGGVTGMYK